jgi:tetratricopeptide (TPR) repeat protein
VTTSSQTGRAPRAYGQPRATWPIVCGAHPQLAVGHVDRPESGPGLPGTLSPGDTVILADADDAPTRALAGLGGTGKTQLAIAAAVTLRESRAIDLLVWVHAGSRAAILTTYAHACGQVGAPGRHRDGEPAARQLLDWLAATGRPWLVVLDGLADPQDLDGLWPAGPAGRTVVTTRRLDSSLRQPGHRIEYVGPFTRREALTCLKAGLDREQRSEALDLADDLGYLPISLGHATAVMNSERLDCRQYRVSLNERRAQLSGSVAEGYPAIIAASWWLAMDSADQMPPFGLARPALILAALLGSNGIPGAVLTSKPACRLINGRADEGAADDETQARRALLNLASLGLATIDGNDAARTVQVHSLVRAAVLESLSAEELALAAAAAANSLVEVWPEDDQADPLMAQALRDGASSLQSISGELLWDPEVHPLLMRTGESLDAARLAGPAVRYWRAMTEKSAEVLSSGHPHALRVRDKLASALVAAGMFDDAIEVSKATLADRERIAGPGHLDSLTARLSLAASFQAAGRLADAIPLYEKSLAEQAWLLGPRHPDTWAWRARLARAYLAAGRAGDAVPLCEQIVADTEQASDPGHGDILAARRGLADAYLAAGRFNEAVRTCERIVVEAELSRGSDHPDMLAAGAGLAAALLRAGRGKDAVRHSKRNLAELERLLGADHLDTLSASIALADAYQLTGQLREAIALYERTLGELERSAGSTDPATVTLRASLASAYHSAGRLADAIPMYRRAIAESERLHAASDPDVITLRGNLAHAYYTAGRPTDAIALLERTLSDCERFLGPDHPLTTTMRENYEAITSE